MSLKMNIDKTRENIIVFDLDKPHNGDYLFSFFYILIWFQNNNLSCEVVFQ